MMAQVSNLAIIDDIDGGARDATEPDIGADEVGAITVMHYRWRDDNGGEAAGGGSVGIGTVVSDAVTGTNTLDLTNVGISGTNRALVVGVCFNNNNQSRSSVVIDPGGTDQTSLTWLDNAAGITGGGTGDDGHCTIWGVKNPPVGSFTVRVTIAGTTLSSSEALIAGAWPLTGVDQTTPFGTAVGNDGVSTGANVTLNWTNADDKWAAIGVSVKPSPGGDAADFLAGEDVKLLGLATEDPVRLRWSVTNESTADTGGI